MKRIARRISALTLLAASMAGAFVVFVVADDALGRAGGVGALVILAALGIAAAALVTRIARRVGKPTRARGVILLAVPVVVGLGTCAGLPERTGDALVRFPDRFEQWGIAGRFVQRLGAALMPSRGSPTTHDATPTASTGAATAPPLAEAGRPPGGPRAPAPRDAAGVADAGGGAFAFGDPSYAEPDCEALADVSALSAAHTAGQMRATSVALAQARYPVGLAFVKAQNDTQLRAWLTGAPDSFDGVASRFEVIVHEGSHVWVAKHSSARVVNYPVRTDLTIAVRRLQNFNRSEVLAQHLDAASDTYAKIYLEGASGAQGFNTLLDEYNAYTHSLASRYCTRDLLASNTTTSARDGILTMMYYVETYLSLARSKHPKDYAAILADPGHRQLILTVWNRAELWLRRSASTRSLGIRDEQIAEWVYEPARLDEIKRVRDAASLRDR